MAYIEMHQTIRQHPKILRVVSELGASKRELIGALTLLWLWCLDYAPEGDLSDLSDAEIALAAEWEGDPAAFVQALVGNDRRPRFLEREGDTLRVHDWTDYAGRLLDARERNAQRMRERREKERLQREKEMGNGVQRTCETRATHVHGNRIISNHIESKRIIIDPRAPDGAIPADSPEMTSDDDFVSVLRQRGATDDEINAATDRMNQRKSRRPISSPAEYLWRIIQRDIRGADADGATSAAANIEPTREQKKAQAEADQSALKRKQTRALAVTAYWETHGKPPEEDYLNEHYPL